MSCRRKRLVDEKGQMEVTLLYVRSWRGSEGPGEGFEGNAEMSSPVVEMERLQRSEGHYVNRQ